MNRISTKKKFIKYKKLTEKAFLHTYGTRLSWNDVFNEIIDSCGIDAELSANEMHMLANGDFQGDIYIVERMFGFYIILAKIDLDNGKPITPLSFACNLWSMLIYCLTFEINYDSENGCIPFTFEQVLAIYCGIFNKTKSPIALEIFLIVFQKKYIKDYFIN